MIHAIQQLPWYLSDLGYVLLGTGLLFSVAFIVLYATQLRNERKTEEGKHLQAMTINIGAFFAVYIVQAIVPDFPGRSLIMLALLLFLVINLGRRLYLLLAHLRERRKARRVER